MNDVDGDVAGDERARASRPLAGVLGVLGVLRRSAAAVGLQRLAVGGAVLGVVVMLAVLGIRLSTSVDGVADAATSAEDAATSSVRIAFPEPGPGVREPEARLRPVGVRSTVVGFEEAVVAVSELPSCAEHDASSGRVVWFDATQSEVDAVAPGEHGAALLLATAGGGANGAPFLGLEDIRIGASVEVARSNATVLAWRVIAVEQVAPGTGFPLELLAPAAEQRLVLVGCGAEVAGMPVDVHVLALRAD